MQFSRVTTLAIASSLTCALPAIAQQTPAAPATGQGAPNAEAATEIRKRFVMDLDTLQSKFLALAEAFPAEKYAWRPGPGVRSVGEVLMHVASEYYVYTPMAFGAARSPLIPRGADSFQKFEASSTKADAMKHLNEGFAYMKQQLAAVDNAKLVGNQPIFGRSMTIIETSIIMTGDLHEHLGQLIAYARANGIKPPWSK
jgi:uncharacterized damage-inducible protein DinB